MAYGNNRAAERPKASFRVAGGIIIKFRHPFLSGQINPGEHGGGITEIDEVDVSKSLRLNDTFLNATPMQDSAVMELLVDGSTVTITNHSLAGTMTLQVLPTNGLVGGGDFIACAHLIIASKDSVGGTMTTIKEVNGRKIIRIYYGTSFKNVPHEIVAGNALVPYTMVLNYAGWVEAVSASGKLDAKHIWAVGNKIGLSAVYQPFSIQLGSADRRPITTGSVTGVAVNDFDDPSGDLNGDIVNTAPLEDTPKEGLRELGDPSTDEW
jgi:hypothetical protein